jgi:hypothetical protein
MMNTIIIFHLLTDRYSENNLRKCYIKYFGKCIFGQNYDGEH